MGTYGEWGLWLRNCHVIPFLVTMSMLRQRTIIVNNYYNNINGTKISEKLSDHWSRSVGVDTVWPLSLQ